LTQPDVIPNAHLQTRGGSGPINMHRQRDFTVARHVETSHACVDTRLHQRLRFNNTVDHGLVKTLKTQVADGSVAESKPSNHVSPTDTLAFNPLTGSITGHSGNAVSAVKGARRR